MSNNDEKVKELLKVIDEKRTKLGKKPKMILVTNGLFKCGGSSININTITRLDDCIDSVALVVNDSGAYKEAAKLLDLEYIEPTYNGYSSKDWIADFKLKASILKWSTEDRKIQNLESNLKDLRSEDLRTEDALSEISKNLS